MNRFLMVTLSAAAMLFPPARLYAQSVVATGLQSPLRMSRTPSGNLLVSEAGTGLNTGRVSLVTRSGVRTTLIDGLPSGPGGDGSVVGPTATILRGNSLLIAIGAGNEVVFGTRPGTDVSNPDGPASPILSSLLSVDFSSDPETIGPAFSLKLPDHFTLSDGWEVTLDNGTGATAVVRLVADFPDVIPDPNAIVKESDPFGMDILPSDPNAVYLTNAGFNSLVRIDLRSGRARTVVHFPPVAVPPGPGMPPVADAVPTSVHAMGGKLLVTFLTGFPFTLGAARVAMVDPRTGQTDSFLTSLTTVMDIGRYEKNGASQYFTIEFSQNLIASPQPAPGRLVKFTGGSNSVISSALITPTGMVVDPVNGDVYVSELATGRILRFVTQ